MKRAQPDSNLPREYKGGGNRYLVFRGGGWSSSDPAWVRASYRYTFAPTIRDNSLGFRCALRGRAPR